jgi:hypothetical protein
MLKKAAREVDFFFMSGYKVHGILPVSPKFTQSNRGASRHFGELTPRMADWIIKHAELVMNAMKVDSLRQSFTFTELQRDKQIPAMARPSSVTDDRPVTSMLSGNSRGFLASSKRSVSTTAVAAAWDEAVASV